MKLIMGYLLFLPHRHSRNNLFAVANSFHIVFKRFLYYVPSIVIYVSMWFRIPFGAILKFKVNLKSYYLYNSKAP